MNLNKNELFELLLFIVTLYVIFRYSLNFKVIYPKLLLELYEEPLFKMILYLLLFIIANQNIKYGLMFFIFLIFLEFDYILFVKE